MIWLTMFVAKAAMGVASFSGMCCLFVDVVIEHTSAVRRNCSSSS